MLTERLIHAFFLCAFAAGCAEGDPPGGDGDGGAPPSSPFDAFKHRTPIDFSAASPADHAIALRFDHAALVAADKAEADGSDVYVVYEDGTELRELTRVLEPLSAWGGDAAVIWFKTGGEGQHYLYYGRRAGEGTPADDPAQVFVLLDEFDDAELDEGWTSNLVGTAMMGDVTVEAGAARVRTVSGDIGGMADSCTLFSRELSGDFVVDVAMRASGGSLGAGSKIGGVMARQSPLPDARFVMLSGQSTPEARVRGVRTVDGEDADLSEQAGAVPYPQLYSMLRRGNAFSVSYSDDAVTWIGVSSAANVTMMDPVLVGVPISNISGGSGHVDVEYFRVRDALLPAPTAQLGEEEAL